MFSLQKKEARKPTGNWFSTTLYNFFMLCSPVGTHQLLAYADDVNILGGSVHTVKKNAEALVAATKEIGLEGNAHKTKYMTVSRDQNAGRIHSMKMNNSSIERVEEFKYLGTTLTNQNSIQEEIKCRLKLGNACYYSVQNLLSSSLLSKTLKIKIYIEFYIYCSVHHNVDLQRNKLTAYCCICWSFHRIYIEL